MIFREFALGRYLRRPFSSLCSLWAPIFLGSNSFFRSHSVPPQKFRYVVEGGVRRCGNQVSVDVQLIVVDDQIHVWRNSFTGDASDILRLQDEADTDIARQIEFRTRGLAPIH